MSITENKYIADVIIPHYDRDDLLKQCLSAINIELFNVIVSTGGTFAENCNKGAQKAVTNNLIFVNDDTEPSDFLLQKMCRLNTDIVGIAQSIPSQQRIIYGLSIQFKKEHTKAYFAHEIDEFSVPSGFLFKISKKTWEQMNGFDEKFMNGWEDVDLFLRCIENGNSFGLVVDSIKHYHSQSEGRKDNNDKNTVYFRQKWSYHKILAMLKKCKKIVTKKKNRIIWRNNLLKVMGCRDDFKLIKDHPLISIIVPSRVGENIQTLASLKKQDYPNIEIIIEYDVNQAGAAATRNYGAKKANGKYLFFCDNDLNLRPDCISNLFLSLVKYPNAKWSFGRFCIDDVLYNKQKSWFPPDDNHSVEWLQYFENISTMSLINVKAFPGFDNAMLRYNDWDLWLTLNRNGYDFAICNKILFETFSRKNGISTTNLENKLYWLEKLYKKYDISLMDYIYILEKKNIELLNSRSFRLGVLFFQLIKKPYKILTFSVEFVKILLGREIKKGLNKIKI